MLDSVLTVAIGRNCSDGSALWDDDWSSFQERVKVLLSEYGTVVAAAVGHGVGSDGVNDSQAEETAVFVVVNAYKFLTSGLRPMLAALLREYGQTSACFAYDLYHEPVFNTVDGGRP